MAFSLDTPLIELGSSASGKTCWTTRNAVEGVQIFGGIGSGKTTGSGRMIALKYLSAGFGGLVLTAKPDEKDLWQEYCRLTGREEDLIIIEPGGKHRFNILDHEINDSSPGVSVTDNIVQVLKTVIRASEEKTSGKSDDPFWETALDMLIFNVIDLSNLAYGRISIQQMYSIVQALPKPDDPPSEKKTAFDIAFDIVRQKVSRQIDEWETQQSVETLRSLTDDVIYDETICNALPDVRALKYINQFFWETFYHLNEKTRSIIEFSFSGFLFRLLREPVYSLFFQGESTFTMQDCAKGQIILLNLPVKVYHKVGRDIQIMFKYIWQRAMEKRNVQKFDKPVFLWADEAQNFLHEHDADYQATARSARIATVYISQNLPNYLASMGGAKPEFKVKSFLGTLGTKIFHANADIETNKYASELIGDGFFEDTSSSSTAAGQFSSTKTKSLKIDRLVRPEEFALLQTGSPANNHKVEGYLHIQGNLLVDRNHIKIRFNQEFEP